MGKKQLFKTILFTLTLSFACGNEVCAKRPPTMQKSIQMVQDSVLRHVVLFKFKAGTTAKNLKTIETAFSSLPDKIPQIMDYEWGLNNSPEGLEKGFTHCFLVTFKNEDDRAIYLPHPHHKAFVDLASPHIEDVLVVDYWTN